MIISRTPIRVSFFGGGTDYRGYYERKRGQILGSVINKYVYVSVSPNSQFFDYKTRIAYRKTELVKNIDEIEHPSVKACLQFMDIQEPLDINIFRCSCKNRARFIIIFYSRFFKRIVCIKR